METRKQQNKTKTKNVQNRNIINIVCLWHFRRNFYKLNQAINNWLLIKIYELSYGEQQNSSKGNISKRLNILKATRTQIYMTF